ncbi:hypothetical protein [Helicobacter typhlonius]|uniref:Periplasmic protein n=1 Tax=Helicobacter typhlonius TaxID=76936 RepID=A0A099UHG8_9HELI|nr:hypothetical protein [Helicobacter typhlonius]TLD77922.1 hypothetical protein LS75_008560 [Helicobacter typhlonius]CUU39836.1 FIG00638667: Hypothetical protein [Helicobacter typhlonius]
MVKKCLLLTLLSICAWADTFDDKIRNLMGEQNYQVNVNFINRIFANKNMYYKGGRLDMAKIVYVLKENGLLTSRFGQPNEVKLSLSARTSPILLTKIGNNVLTSMGYSYFVISKAELSSGLSSIEFSFNTEHSPDMGIIINELSKRGFVCLDINRVGTYAWEYTLEVYEPRLPNTKFLAKGANLDLRNTSGEYWLNINSGGDLSIQPINMPKWNPRVVLYDRNLSIVDMVNDTGSSANLKVKIPQGVKFVMITDYDSPESLKNGISVNLH